MNQDSMASVGKVASLHLHPEIAGTPLRPVDSIRVIESKGIEGNPRYFARKNREGLPSKRQITLIEREQIAEHATALHRRTIDPGLVRSNIETTGIDLIALLGKEVEIGDAILNFYAPRDPCEKMDAICQGLRARMMSNRQGVLAQVVKSGTIKIGDSIRPKSG